MSEKPLLEMIGIDKTFGRQTVLKNCSLTVQRGETVVLIGPSGSGKSTLLRCVNMLSPADSGDVFFASQHISRGDVPAHKLRQRLERPLRHRASRLHPARKGRRGALLRRDGPEAEPVALALAERRAAQRLPGAHRRGGVRKPHGGQYGPQRRLPHALGLRHAAGPAVRL